LEILYVVTC